MSDQTVLLPKWFSHQRIILTKGQLGHSYTFWNIPILIISPFSNFEKHPLQNIHKLGLHNFFPQAKVALCKDRCELKKLTICSLLQQWLQNNFYTWFTVVIWFSYFVVLEFTEFKRTALHYQSLSFMCVVMFYTLINHMIVAYLTTKMWITSLFSFRYHATYIFNFFVPKNDSIYKSGGVLIEVLFSLTILT